MPAANLLWPMWDAGTRRDPAHLAPFGGIRIKPADPLVADNYGDRVARFPLMALVGLHTRVKSFRLAGHVLQSIDGTSGTAFSEGDILLDLNAIEYTQGYPTEIDQSAIVTCADEYALSRFGGWYGFNQTGAIDASGIALWLGGIIYPWGTTDEAGQQTALECTICQPDLRMSLAPVFAGSGFAQIGRGTTDDDCPITCTLSADDAGFNGTGCTGFSLQMGVADPSLGRLTGSLTLSVTEWWGHGGRYDAVTGAGV